MPTQLALPAWKNTGQVYAVTVNQRNLHNKFLNNNYHSHQRLDGQAGGALLRPMVLVEVLGRR